MTGSIAKLADAVLAEVKVSKLTELATHQIIKEASVRSVARTTMGKLLQKVAESVRAEDSDISIDEIRNFIEGVGNAV